MRRWRRFWTGVALPAALAWALAAGGCKPLEHAGPEEENATPAKTPVATPAPSPTPEPSPTPIVVPSKKLDTGRLFNGLQLQTSFATEPGRNATAEAADPGSYSLHLDLRVRVPTAVTGTAELVALNPALPAIFPNFGDWIKTAKVSPLYERFYRYKLHALQQDLVRLDQLLTRHDFYDCETVLEISGTTGRRVLWLQSDMDVDSDGSDTDRVPLVDGSSPTFQPITSYKWTKRTEVPNPFVAQREAKVRQLEGELPTRTAAQLAAAKNQIGDLMWEISQLKKNSFLVAATDPYVVMSWSVEGKPGESFSPSVGDYCAVIYGNTIYPAIVGDVGPADKMGEASLRLAQQLNSRATAENRPVSALKITYLVFPGTAEKPFAPPNLDHWRAKVDGYLKELGGYNAPLFAWKDLTAPTPTPTPVPTPTPAASPSVSPVGSPAPASPSPSPSAAPAAAPR